MPCVHEHIEASLDRWQEVHWQIHQIEQNYHDPEGVRYSFNALIRAAKEIPQIASMELQNRADYQIHIKPRIESLKTDPLFSLLSKKRNYIVHSGMLEVSSSGSIGTTEGRGRWKFGCPFPVGCWESSDDAYARFIEICKANKDFRRLMGPDCDSWPMLQRRWCLPEFPDKDFLAVAVTAWRTSGSVLSDILIHLGGDGLDLELQCAHDPERVRSREYSQEEFFRVVDGINIQTGEQVVTSNA
jgi:hypothetical protein